MTRKPITLDDLNHFTLVASEPAGDQTRLLGRLSKPGQAEPADGVRLVVGHEEDVPGDLVEVDPDARTAVITCQTQYLHPSVVPGSSFPIVSDYWLPRLQLVLDASARWTLTRFSAPDAFEQDAPTPGWRQARIAQSGDENRTDGVIVPGGWDHEHCEICGRKIGTGGEPNGHVNARGQWICVGCFAHYVESGDLSFVLGRAGDDDVTSNEEKSFEDVSRLIDDYDWPKIRDLLRARGVDVRNRYGWTPLMLAASRGQRSLVARLLAEGAEVNAVAEAHGYTALALAAQKGYAEVVEILLEAGAGVQVPQSFCGGSLMLYVKTGRGQSNARVMELLTRAGAT